MEFRKYQSIQIIEDKFMWKAFLTVKSLQALFNHLKGKASKLSPKISMTFISAGPKMPSDRIASKIRQILGTADGEKIQECITAINGAGSCSEVYGAVESLNSAGYIGIKGLVDCDEKNNTTSNVQVFAENYAYAIENVILDPLCILLHLHISNPSTYSMEKLCGENIPWADWLQSTALLQNSLDYFLRSVLSSENVKDERILYKSGIALQTDKRYLRMHGHTLEATILQRFPELKGIARPQREGELKFKIVTSIMITASGGKLIPNVIEESFAELQK